jgi:hypothetical protein
MDETPFNLFVVLVVLTFAAFAFAVYAIFFVSDWHQSLLCLLLAILFALWAIGCLIDLSCSRIVNAIKAGDESE